MSELYSVHGTFGITPASRYKKCSQTEFLDLPLITLFVYSLSEQSTLIRVIEKYVARRTENVLARRVE
jgi:hypothetical protein